ncbi:hypothetical protein [Streptomyces sp. NBC_00557]|uniref:hypothetical protein n=1 Tax=Streptomyces sp. NBC_00557 TaxID=2975776 RepID=UPI002E81F06F|nr:hypothetical protein [Streptomyces sp. NBC_00557]WUC39692.1 hypothetical protein OG956_38695 [Streptomyces sp. NBC_00557]
MSGSDRLFILSTASASSASGEPGPCLLINDPVVAMRWYLAHEQDDVAVSVRRSRDGGRTWQPLQVPELLAEAKAHQAVSGRTGDTALLWDALAAEAAAWLHQHLSHVAGEEATWQLGGQIWALAMGTVPHDDVLTHLATRSLTARVGEEEFHAARAGAAQIVNALAVAAAPGSAEMPDLLKASALLYGLASRVPTGPLRDRLHQAQERLLNHLDQRVRFIPGDDTTQQLEQTGPTTRQPGGPGHPQVHRAAEPEPAVGVSLPGVVMAGFPLRFGDKEAAAAWRVLCPPARREAEHAMDELMRAEARLLQAKATAQAGGPEPAQTHTGDALSRLRQIRERRRTQGLEADARGGRAYARHRLEDLDARHAVLWHGLALVDAQHAAQRARHVGAVAAAQATLSPADQPPPTMQQVLAEHDAFNAYDTQLQTVREHIDHILAEQRQATRDALHRLLPRTVGRRAMARLRTQLVDNSPLGRNAELKAIRALFAANAEFETLQARFTNGTPQPGRPPVTENEVHEAQGRLRQAERELAELRSARLDTLRALDALDSVADLTPTPATGSAARATQITAESRARTHSRTHAAGRPRHDDRTAEQHPLPHGQAPPRGTGLA